MERKRATQREPVSGDSYGRLSASSSQGKLDLNAPLLSLRRHATFGGPDEESASRSLRNPGAVPFIWEHSPGQPKARQITLSVLPAIPAPPHGRSSPTSNERANGNANPSHDREIFHCVSHDQRGKLSVDEVPAGAFVPTPFSPSKTLQAQTQRHSTVMAESWERRPSAADDPTNCNNSTDECEAFSDAVDTFDQTEDQTRGSVISTLDEQSRLVFAVDRVDHHSRDFIMRRFLPAAKAMAVESPIATTSLSERNNHRRIPQSPLGQLQRSSFPRPPITDRLANLTDKRAAEYASDNEDHESTSFSTKSCGFLPHRLGAAFRNLLPQSSPVRSNSKSKLHLVQFHRRSNAKNAEISQESGRSSNQDESSESSGSEDESESTSRVRYGLRSESERGTLIGTGLLNRIRQSPQQHLNSNRALADPAHSHKVGSVSMPSYETKGFLGLPKDVALSISKKHGHASSHLGTAALSLPQTQRPSSTESNARYGGSISKNYASLGSPSLSEMQFHFGMKLENGSGLSSLRPSNVADGADRSEISGNSSDTSSLYGHGSPGATAETGETSTTEAKTDICRECGSNLHPHPKAPSSGGKGVSMAAAEGPAWHLNSSNRLSPNPTFASRPDRLEYRKLSAFADQSDQPDCRIVSSQAKIEINSSEKPYTYTPSRVLPPPLPRSPSHSWLWRKSPASASFLGSNTPDAKSPSSDIMRMKSVKWESMVKSGNSAGHLRYSERSSPLVHD